MVNHGKRIHLKNVCISIILKRRHQKLIVVENLVKNTAAILRWTIFHSRWSRAKFMAF